MPDSLVSLESRRAAVQSQIAQLGDMRAGSITGTGGRCGNPNCHCRRAGDPGHGPYYRLTRKVHGKTVTETFSSPVASGTVWRQPVSGGEPKQVLDGLGNADYVVVEKGVY